MACISSRLASSQALVGVLSRFFAAIAIAAAIARESASAAPPAALFPDLEQLPSIPEMPDPLRMMSGEPATTLDDWNTRRKPELKALFQHYMYGELPPAIPIRATVRRVDRDALHGKATLKQVTIAFGPPDAPTIDLLLIVPNAPAAPLETKPPAKAPKVILGLNFTGNQTVLADPRIQLAHCWMANRPGIAVDHKAVESGRGSGVDQWQAELVIERGYALATFCYGDVMPDDAKLAEKSRAFFGGLLAARDSRPTDAKAEGTGAIMAWAWGLHRAVDYLSADADIDPKSIIVYGHSRNGKAAIVAAAFDDRIAAAIPHQAGCGGTAPDRRHNSESESVTRINNTFPHWFNGEFKKFNEREDRLPFDQNCLAAMCFPRPLLFSCGQQDQWADPPGELDVLKSTGRVYQQFGVEGIDPKAKPLLDRRIGKRLCYFVNEDKHTINRAYWEAFLAFADQAF